MYPCCCCFEFNAQYVVMLTVNINPVSWHPFLFTISFPAVVAICLNRLVWEGYRYICSDLVSAREPRKR